MKGLGGDDDAGLIACSATAFRSQRTPNPMAASESRTSAVATLGDAHEHSGAAMRAKGAGAHAHADVDVVVAPDAGGARRRRASLQRSDGAAMRPTMARTNSVIIDSEPKTYDEQMSVRREREEMLEVRVEPPRARAVAATNRRDDAQLARYLSFEGAGDGHALHEHQSAALLPPAGRERRREALGSGASPTLPAPAAAPAAVARRFSHAPLAVDVVSSILSCPFSLVPGSSARVRRSSSGRSRSSSGASWTRTTTRIRSWR